MNGIAQKVLFAAIPILIVSAWVFATHGVHDGWPFILAVIFMLASGAVAAIAALLITVQLVRRRGKA
jgi:hypothetical protein